MTRIPNVYNRASDLLYYEEENYGKKRTDHLCLGRLRLASRTEDRDASVDDDGNGIPDCEEPYAQGNAYAPVLGPIGDQNGRQSPRHG